MQRRMTEAQADPRELLVPITADKGLCGGINSGIFRDVRSYLLGKDRSKVSICAVGDKACVAMKRPFADILQTSISDLSKPINFPIVMAVAEQVTANSGDKDKIIVFYNEFKSAISQIVRRMELMPKHVFMETLQKNAKLHFKGNTAIPDKNTSAPALYDLYITSNLWHAFLHNGTSEESARMNAMENASKNAGEIVDKLTL